MKKTIPGKVYLVGAGPGDPELLTLKAHALIREADAIFHDDLVSPAILALADSRAVVVNVGKRCGTKKISQLEINLLLIDCARKGWTVVRLKSGDPGIFGRLAEERDAMQNASIPYEIVPGVTTGLAAAASLGISLTDRRTSSRIVIVSAHRAPENEQQAPTDWHGLAAVNSTLIFYMPGRDFASLQQELLGAGLDIETPAAIVSAASTPQQREHHTTLGRLDRVPSMPAPSILLIGQTIGRTRQAGTDPVSLTSEPSIEGVEVSVAASS